MPASVLSDKSLKLDDIQIKNALGIAYPLWEDLRMFISENYRDVRGKWKFYGEKSGWTMKLLLKKRNLFFFIAEQNSFALAFVFGDKAVNAAEASVLPAEIIQEMLSARKYAEGRGLRIDVRKKSDIKIVKQLLQIKVDN